ncbi:MAG: hypothetical protein LBR26_09480 [Prevotella sp.]|jgi:hypothetical protein|nr:hypothetical protein [Prevotella sp.]
MKIAGKEYILKYTLRSLIVYEELTGAAFAPGLLKNEIILYYAIIVANNPQSDLSFDQFFEAIDEEKLLPDLRKWLVAETKKLDSGEENGEQGEKKKNKRKRNVREAGI